MTYEKILKAGFDESKHPRGKGGKFVDSLSYEALSAKDFKVSRGEAAIVMKRTVAAQKALDVLRDVLQGDEQSFGDDITTVNETLKILRRRVIPRALLKVQADEEPLILD